MNEQEIRHEMIVLVRENLGAGYVDEYYAQIAEEFVQVALAYRPEPELVVPQPTLGPDEFSCKKCGEPVRYAKIVGAPGNYGAAFDAKQVTKGGYQLTDDGEGEWLAQYVRVEDRPARSKGFRRHNCKGVKK